MISAPNLERRPPPSQRLLQIYITGYYEGNMKDAIPKKNYINRSTAPNRLMEQLKEEKLAPLHKQLNGVRRTKAFFISVGNKENCGFAFSDSNKKGREAASPFGGAVFRDLF
jgi:hypothetical protein